MKIVASSDWRDAIPFDTLVLVADVVPGEPTRCFTCGADSEPRERTELWAYKHRHPKNHDGYVRFYCAEHRVGSPGTTSATSTRVSKGMASRQSDEATIFMAFPPSAGRQRPDIPR